MNRPVLTSFLVFGLTSAAALGADLSKYRDFQFGTDLQTISKQVDANPSQVKTISTRPALIQELDWRPQPLGPSSQAEPAKEVVFSFYNGELFRVAVNYDRYQTEGLTVEDMVQTISTAYGPAAKPLARDKSGQGLYDDSELVLARWQDPLYRFDLVRSSYGPDFRLVGVSKKMEALAQTATVEAKRLDDKEAPQRDAARLANEEDAAKAKLEKSRLVNKPKFRP